jgi:hypothetical protein
MISWKLLEEQHQREHAGAGREAYLAARFEKRSGQGYADPAAQAFLCCILGMAAKQ